jgi:hypothetical protein
VVPHPPLDAADPAAIIIGEPAADVLYRPRLKAYQINLSAGGRPDHRAHAHGLFDGLQTLWQLVEQARSAALWHRGVKARSGAARGASGTQGRHATAEYWQDAIRR